MDGSRKRMNEVLNVQVVVRAGFVKLANFPCTVASSSLRRHRRRISARVRDETRVTEAREKRDGRAERRETEEGKR